MRRVSFKPVKPTKREADEKIAKFKDHAIVLADIKDVYREKDEITEYFLAMIEVMPKFEAYLLTHGIMLIDTFADKNKRWKSVPMNRWEAQLSDDAMGKHRRSQEEEDDEEEDEGYDEGEEEEEEEKPRPKQRPQRKPQAVARKKKEPDGWGFPVKKTKKNGK